MPTKHSWVSAWFLITAPVIFWDAAYCFLRPRSMVGGDLHWIWNPYALYADVDHVYGLPSFNRGDGFPNAQSFMNVVETFMNLGYVYFTHVRPATGAPLLGFAAIVMTLSKTILYWMQDYFCSWCTTGHNPPMKWIVLFAIPNKMMNDYRTVLYRLDLATSHPSIPALIQYFMDESPLDGTIEIRVVTAPNAGDPHIPTPPRSPGGYQGTPSQRDHHISFSRAENGRDVYARCAFGFLPDPQLNVNSSPTQRSAYVHTPVLAVTHEFSPKTPVAAAFIPIIEHFLRNDHDLSSVIFECRSYLQPSPSKSSNPLEILDRAAPYKRMFGYVGRVRGGMTIYELDDTVTGTMFSTMTPTGFPLT